MKIWILTNAYLPETGGLVTYTRSLAKTVKNLGYEVEIITSNAKDKRLKKVEEIEGVKVRRIDFSGIIVPKKIITPLIFYTRIKKELRKIDIGKDDLVISRFYSFQAAVCDVWKGSKNIFISPLVAEELNKLDKRDTSFLRKIYLSLINPQIKYLDKKAFKGALFKGVLSESKRSEVSKYYHVPLEQIAVIRPGVDTDRFSIPDKEEKIRIRNLLGYTPKDFVVVCVGRLSSEKNIEQVIKAFKYIKNNTIKLAIIGEGTLRNVLQKKISDMDLKEQVILYGAKQNVEEFYHMADMFVLVSRYEGFGHVYLEALSCGLYCIAAKNNPPYCITASDEILINDKLGKLVDYDSSQDIANEIINFSQQKDIYVQYRHNYIESKYSWNQHYSQIEEVIK
ncbi:MAG: glycosyltransferase family 4 protein [Lachnospiraceae bacterium]|nr:glycosyltransferase family 4 protein [Lachnospiraceae bacterium]